MKKINRKVILAISLVGVLVLGLIWIVFFLQVPRIKYLSEAIQKEKLNSFVRQEKGSKIFKLKKDISDIEEQKKEMEAVFLPKNEAVPFLRALEQAAGVSSCQIKVEAADLSKVKFSQQKTSAKTVDETDEEETTSKTTSNSGDKGQPSETAKADEIAKLKIHPSFNIEVSGSFPSTMNFLEKMENLSYFVRVLTLDISEEKKNNQSGSSNVGTLSLGSQAGSSGPESPGKTVKMSLLVIIYSNEKK